MWEGKPILKLFGYRISLDETERLIKENLVWNHACVGNDKKWKYI